MIVVFYLEDMSTKVQGQFYESMIDFAQSVFDIKVEDAGHVSIGGEPVSSHSYALGDDKKTQYTKEEALKDYVKSASFRSYLKCHFYTVYKTEKIV